MNGFEFKMEGPIMFVVCLVAIYVAAFFFIEFLGVYLLHTLLFGFLFLVYFFIIRPRNLVYFGARLIVMGLLLVLFVESTLFFGVEPYIENKYNLTERGQYLFCDKGGYRSIIGKCISPANLEAEKEANLIIDITSWVATLSFLLGVVIEVLIYIKNKMGVKK